MIDSLVRQSLESISLHPARPHKDTNFYVWLDPQEEKAVEAEFPSVS